LNSYPPRKQGSTTHWTTFNRIAASLAVFLLFAAPLSVFAGAFSLVADILGKQVSAKGADSLPNQNSQTLPLLVAVRNPDPNADKGGGDITIVGDQALLAETGPIGSLADVGTHRASSDQISLYIVREGDTLSQIARMFSVSVNTIIWSNDIRGSVISPGQELVILPVSGIRHTVVKGETLASIAKKYKGDIDEILDFNNLPDNAKIAVGDVVVIPDGEIAAPAVPTITSPLRGAGGPSIDGYFIRPISGGRKSQGLHGYNGVDLATYAGAPIVAAASGDVIISREGGWNGGYGNYIVIKHNNGTQTLYAHNSSNIVSVGEHVVQGQVIGYVGSTGKSTGNHVHFEVRGATNPF